jgi:hypothetical protein
MYQSTFPIHSRAYDMPAANLGLEPHHDVEQARNRGSRAQARNGPGIPRINNNKIQKPPADLRG